MPSYADAVKAIKALPGMAETPTLAQRLLGSNASTLRRHIAEGAVPEELKQHAEKYLEHLRSGTSSTRKKTLALTGLGVGGWELEGKPRVMQAQAGLPLSQQLRKVGSVLTAKTRENLSESQFAIPEGRKYPIHDIAHARNALARVSQYGTPAEKSRVRSAVYSKYPELKENAEQDKTACLLEGKYPINAPSDVEAAIDYFAKHASAAFTPMQQREYVTNLLKFSDELGYEVPGEMRKMASTHINCDLREDLGVRKFYLSDEQSQRMTHIIKEAAQYGPDATAYALQQLDVEFGISHLWNGAIKNPVETVFGEKVASAWENIGERLVSKHAEQLKTMFGDGFVEELSKDPNGILESLDAPTKTMLSRLAESNV